MKLPLRMLLWLIATTLALPAMAGAQNYSPPPEDQAWLAATAQQSGTIPPGTTITTQNWRQYEQFMPHGMIGLFEGKYFWKMPSDVQLDVGPTVLLPLPKGYVAATEQYGNQVRVVHQPGGHMDVAGYVAGRPFPNPQAPDRGYKILSNVWFTYLPHLYNNTPENTAKTCTQDRFGNTACLTVDFVYRQVAYNTDPGVPGEEKGIGDAWYTEWLMVETPEQSRYTAQLIVFPKSNQKDQDSYVFVPALRRSLRLATSARCAPVLGTDYVQDDYNTKGFNGGLGIFDAKYLGQRKVLAFLDDYKNVTGRYPEGWAMPLGFPKPAWGKWQVRAVDIIDVRRIPSEAAGYCYGSRILYVDRHNFYTTWTELYDSNMRLWKTGFLSPHAVTVPQVGHVTTNSVVAAVWDIQNDHSTIFSSIDAAGHDVFFNQQAPAQYHNLSRYSTPGGLMQIMQ